MKSNLFLSVILTTLFYASISISFAQDKEDINYLTTPDNWRKEIFDFPLSFAPSIKYKGIEDIRFANGWAKKESDEFWTYTFLWYLDNQIKISSNTLEDDLEVYFDGLMEKVSGKNKGEIPITNALFTAVETAGDLSIFKGKVKFYDVFFTKDIMTLNVTVESNFCHASQKHSVLFKLSPKEENHATWAKLNQVKEVEQCQTK